ncbi:MAG TPA: 5-methyltetrahydropteroyltriglutamate--homocysteine S-methyltransferase, partial [Sphingomonas sp.]|nr:5-methyltetrahydropteroyltriglutamate--homocysteine S-methyltransferase [Sphingomonas sp.]
MTVTIATLGFPRIGPRRELKFALESFWSGQSSERELLEAAAGLRTAAWARQKSLGADWLPSNDFSLYDHVLDTSLMLGAIPERYGKAAGDCDLGTYFAMARGTTGNDGGEDNGCGHDHNSLTACEMTKWFDTNYHYMVPELVAGQKLALSSAKIVDEYREAKAQGFETRPVLLGPVTWLSLAKDRGVDPFNYLDEVLGLYSAMLTQLGQAGAEWVQIDEPVLVLDLTERQRNAITRAYAKLPRAGVKLMLATYFGGLEDNLDLAIHLPVAGLHVDLVRAPQQLDAVLAKAPKSLLLSLGVIDGRNVWRADLAELLDRLEPIATKRDIVLAPSCSLLHTPVDLALERKIDPEVAQWLAFAVQKVGELATLKRALNEGRDSAADELAESSAAAAA